MPSWNLRTNWRARSGFASRMENSRNMPGMKAERYRYHFGGKAFDRSRLSTVRRIYPRRTAGARELDTGLVDVAGEDAGRGPRPNHIHNDGGWRRLDALRRFWVQQPLGFFEGAGF